MNLTDIKPGVPLVGLEPGVVCTVVATTPLSVDTMQVYYRLPDGTLKERLLGPADESAVSPAVVERPWALDGDGAAFQLACEAKRIDLAFLFDPMMAVHTSNVDPLPHQITAVYESLLPRQPLRYVLADDPGAGKTIMAGLYIRELVMRADARRVLIIAPGSLVDQWRDELFEKFGLEFKVYSGALDEGSPSGNPFEDHNQLIVRLDQLSRDEDTETSDDRRPGPLQSKLLTAGWDLVVFDEAHKLAAHFYGSKLEKTARFRLAERVGKETRHLLLMTAIRYGDQPAVRARLTQRIDHAFNHDHLRSLLNRNALAEQTMSPDRLFKVKEEMEKAEARRLQPFFVRSFFMKAFTALGGTIHRREPERYEITHVPLEIRERDRRITGRNRRESEPVLKRYDRVCFERSAIQPNDKPGLPRAVLMHPGHPLMLSVTDLVLEQNANLLRQGSVLVDPTDDGDTPWLLFLLTHEVKSGDGTVLSKRMQFIRVTPEGNASFAGWAPHLDLEPLAAADRPRIASILSAPWLRSDMEQRAVALAATSLVPDHFREVATRRVEHVDRTLAAVHERLTKEIDFWTDREIKLRDDRAADADASGTSPGKEVLRQLLERCAPCVVLMDELVAYIRQFPEGTALSGGTFESNISFVQALTEASKLVPTAVILASLPESVSQQSNTNVQVGGARGLAALMALESVFGRVQALWKPVATEEAFEIVRRRLFEPLKDEKARDAICRAFVDGYEAEGAKLPSETHEARYFERMCKAYPIHPEVFDRLYEDWTTIDGFQRTRGVLKLMAKVISRLWKDNNQDLMIMPGSLPLADGDVRNELTYLLPPGWDPVIERDIDGERAETTELEGREPRLGQVNAARRVGRTLFLGTAPSSAATKPGIRGLDRGRVLLGCLQPGQTSAVYLDALSRLADRLHYLNSSGDKAADSTRFWFDTRANLRREMEDRKRRFDDNTDVRKRIEEVAKKLFSNVSMFEGVHVFTAHADVPDDSALRLVVLPLEASYAKDNTRLAEELVQTFLRSHGGQPRHRANRLVFVAADQAVLGRLRDVTRTALAWASIVDDVESNRLNIDKAQHNQAKKEAAAAAEVVPRAARECFKWLLCPAQDDPTATKATVEAFPFNTSSGTAGGELERVCKENELVIDAWSPIHLRAKLKEFYWKPDRAHVDAKVFWEDSLKYLYLPRLRSHEVLASAIRAGAGSRDFFATAYGHADGKYEGFQFGKGGASLSDSVLLIAPEAAAQYESTLPSPVTATSSGTAPASGAATGTATFGSGKASPMTSSGDSKQPARPKNFRGAAEIPATLAKSRLNTIAEEVIALLASDPNATVRITLEIDASFPDGASDSIRRGVSENANNLGFNAKDWE